MYYAGQVIKQSNYLLQKYNDDLLALISWFLYINITTNYTLYVKRNLKSFFFSPNNVTHMAIPQTVIRIEITWKRWLIDVRTNYKYGTNELYTLTPNQCTEFGRQILGQTINFLKPVWHLRKEKKEKFLWVLLMYWGGMGGNMGWGMNMMNMGEEEGWRKGPWTAEEDRLLIEYVRLHGEGRWNSVSRLAGTRKSTSLSFHFFLFLDNICYFIDQKLQNKQSCFHLFFFCENIWWCFFLFGPLTGLKRNGKSCRLRWVNYLRPDLKKGQITPQEESVIVELHARWGNRYTWFPSFFYLYCFMG